MHGIKLVKCHVCVEYDWTSSSENVAQILDFEHALVTFYLNLKTVRESSIFQALDTA